MIYILCVFYESKVYRDVEIVQRVQDDVRIALECYYANNQLFPAMNRDAGIPGELTTPIAYLKYPLATDCKYFYFKNSGVCMLQNNGLDQKSSISNPFFVQAAQNDAEWIQSNFEEFCYDPTNGLKSSGDIIKIILPYKSYLSHKKNEIIEKTE